MIMYRHGARPKRDITKPAVEFSPDRAELEEHCKTLNAKQIGQIYGVSAKRVRSKCKALKLVPQKEIRPFCGIERDFGAEHVVEWIKTHTIGEANALWPHTDQVFWKWERHYGVRFLRVCKNCQERKTYDEMALKNGSQIYHICRTCYQAADRPKIWSKSNRTSHHDRMDDEYANVPPLARVAWSASQGINGVLRGMSLGGFCSE